MPHLVPEGEYVQPNRLAGSSYQTLLRAFKEPVERVATLSNTRREPYRTGADTEATARHRTLRDEELWMYVLAAHKDSRR